MTPERFVARPIPRTGQRGLDADAAIKLASEETIRRLYGKTATQLRGKDNA